jgi:transposase
VRRLKRQQGVALQSAVYEHPQRYLAVGLNPNDLDRGGLPMGNCAGVDWASEEHATCVVSDEGHVMFERAFLHSEGGMAELCVSLVANDVDRVALERPDGIVCERLLEAGISVVAIHPNQLKATRDRYTVSRRKSDRFDAFCLAELCRTDMHRFRVLRPDSDETKALRALTRSRQQLVNARQILANQLRAELEAFWPGAACVFSAVDSEIALHFIERYPSPADARGLGEKRLALFLERHSYPRRRTPKAMIQSLRQAPLGTAGELETEARRAAVLALVEALRPLVKEIKRMTARSGPSFARTRTARCSCRSFAIRSPALPPRGCSPRSAIRASVTRPPRRSRPTRA